MTREGHTGNRTTLQVRREIQRRRDEPSRKLAVSLGFNPKTIDKWKRRETIHVAPMGPKHPVSTTLSAAEEALIVVFRKHARLTLDDSLARLKPLIPKLSRSALHRCLKRYGVSRISGGRAKKLSEREAGRQLNVMTLATVALPEVGEEACLLCAIGGDAIFVHADVVDALNANTAADFLYELAERAPFPISAIETNSHEAFTDTPDKPWNPAHPEKVHPFRQACTDCRIKLWAMNWGDPIPNPVAKGWTDVFPHK